ncbi:MAG: hypothetical protein KTR31_10190 [Myxococcales bacterium]|nr:hypothetical protein [Myxococcales bacterium]
MSALNAAAELSAGLDSVLGAGFARLAPKQVQALEECAAACAGTPLGPTVAEAVTALAGGELLAHHLAALAAARAALEGARADALLAEVADSRGLVLEPTEVQPPVEAEPETLIRMESARQWLVEVALAGLCQLDNATIVPVVGTLEGIQAMPELAGLSALLTGFASELLDHAPTSGVADPPLRRWADLWGRCLLATYRLPERPTTRTVSGSLIVLGADIRHHDHLLSAVVHGLLDDDGTKRLVRTTLSAWKVDAIAGAEIWTLLHPLAPELVDAVGQGMTLSVRDMTLTSAGDLLWDGTVAGSEPADPFAADLSGAVVAAPAPRNRHPVQLAIPVVFATAGIADMTVDGLAIDMARVSPYSGYAADEVAQSEGLVGLLRFDEAWTVQPLAGRKGKKVFGPAVGIAKAAKVKKPALGILRERASKLLRA